MQADEVHLKQELIENGVSRGELKEIVPFMNTPKIIAENQAVSPEA